MARAQGLYSHVIAWLKILLPLVALGLLSTIFLFSRSTDPVNKIPFAETLQRAGDTMTEMVSGPYYAGTTARGDTLTMTARSALPKPSGEIEAKEVSARMQMVDGSELRLKSELATLQDGEQKVTLHGGVHIESSTGYNLLTETLISAIDQIDAESVGPVKGEGPLGTLAAGKMRIKTVEGSEDVQILFTGGVKLLYLPQNK
ncbi:MAG: LPS export ABC transporter periplasmic protein LptC [Pelagimonas sp.]|uniref:LPS export ABC transporter periplasmic protein LptC n=1 Tax=Pelagimonas sp. TaxID=2073170 RepID=UPI003D6B5C30